MLTRRHFIATGAATTGAFLGAGLEARAEDDPNWRLSVRYEPQVVEINPGFTPGEIHVDMTAHFLYQIREDNTALRYGVAVGREGRQAAGRFRVGRKAEWPRWQPTAAMIAREPDVYGPFAAGMEGGPDNPLGARAMYLYAGARDTMLRIHGTPQPWSIGTSASSGCVRMVNDHVIALYDTVDVGTRVTLHRG